MLSELLPVNVEEGFVVPLDLGDLLLLDEALVGSLALHVVALEVGEEQVGDILLLGFLLLFLGLGWRFGCICCFDLLLVYHYVPDLGLH